MREIGMAKRVRQRRGFWQLRAILTPAAILVAGAILALSAATLAPPALMSSALAQGTEAEPNLEAVTDAAPLPQTPQMPAPPEMTPGQAPALEQAACPVPPLPHWTQSEKYTWKQVCLRRWAELAIAFEDPKPATGDLDQWKPERNLSAAFLLRIMTDPVYVAATPFSGIRIDGAHFPEQIYLSDLEYNKPLVINNSVFSKPLVLERFRSRSRVSLLGSWLRFSSTGEGGEASISLDGTAAEFAKGLDLNGTFVNGEVDLTDVNVASHLEMNDATFLNHVWLDRARIGGVLFLQRTTIGDALTLDGADVAQNIQMSNLSISRVLENGDTEYGTLSGVQLHVSGHLVLGYSEVQIRMPQRLVGQAQPQAAPTTPDPPIPDSPTPESTPPDQGQGDQGGGGSESDVLPNPAASLPAPGDSPPLGATNLAGDTLTQTAGGNATVNPAAPERSFTVRAWRIDLTGARIDGELRIRGARVLDRVTLEDAVIGDDVWLSESDFDKAMFSATSVKGFVLLQGSHAATSLQFDSSSVGRSIVMDDQTRIVGLRMPGAAVKGGIYFAGATIEGVVDLTSIAVDRDLALGDGSVFTGPVDASFARIGGSLDLTGGRFASVDLTGAQIAAELRLAAAGAVPFFAREAELNLRNATTNSLQDVAESWPCVLHLEGFTYQRQIRSESKSPPPANATDPCDKDQSAGQPSDQAPESGAAASNPPSDAGAKAAAEDRAGDLVAWLSRQEPFSPQPYVQLANVLRQSGDNETAKAILFAGKQREWEVAGPWSTFLLSLQFAFTGFGLYPYVAGYWVLALIGLGTLLFSFDPSPELRRFTWTQRLIYSFDMLIPAVHLRHHHAEIELQSWPRYYLYGHKLMGYILLSFLAAALLGLGGLE